MIKKIHRYFVSSRKMKILKKTILRKNRKRPKKVRSNLFPIYTEQTNKTQIFSVVLISFKFFFFFFFLLCQNKDLWASVEVTVVVVVAMAMVVVVFDVFLEEIFQVFSNIIFFFLYISLAIIHHLNCTFSQANLFFFLRSLSKKIWINNFNKENKKNAERMITSKSFFSHIWLTKWNFSSFTRQRQRIFRVRLSFPS